MALQMAGPAEEVRELVKQLEAENIFARALDTNGVPYHSSVLQPLLPELDKCEPFFLESTVDLYLRKLRCRTLDRRVIISCSTIAYRLTFSASCLSGFVDPLTASGIHRLQAMLYMYSSSKL